MNVRHCFILVFITLTFSACKEEIDPRYEQFERTASKVQDLDLLAQQAILLIPNGGCDGCITAAEGFAMRNIDDSENLSVIFTGTESQKALRLKVGDHLYGHQRVHIDKANLFYEGNLMSLYPAIIYLKDRNVVRIVEQKPQTFNALDSLQSVLLQH